MDIIYQIIGLGLLLGALAAGWRRWILPHTLNRTQQGLLFLVMLTFFGGLIGSFFWWFDVRQSFAWDLPPLASRMLAAASWSFAVVSFVTLQRPAARRVNLVLWMLLVYLAPLALAIVLLHLDRFDAAAPITYGFFIIVLLMVALTSWYLLRPVVILPDDDLRPPTRPVQVWLGAVGILTTLWGAALFLSSDGASDLIWVWRGDLLSSQLIGVMLLTIATGVAVSIRHADPARLMLLVTLVYGAGLALASLWNALADKPIKVSYVVVFGIIFLGSSALLWGQRRLPEIPTA